jgi:hypothetical protein
MTYVTEVVWGEGTALARDGRRHPLSCVIPSERELTAIRGAAKVSGREREPRDLHDPYSPPSSSASSAAASGMVTWRPSMRMRPSACSRLRLRDTNSRTVPTRAASS